MKDKYLVELLEDLEASAENLAEEEPVDSKLLLSVVDKLRSNPPPLFVPKLSKDESKALEEELIRISTFDYWSNGARKKAIEELMAALGFLEEYDQKAYYSSKPKTRIILGIRYIVG